MINIFFNPATQFENTGDILINKVLVNFLCKHGKVFIEDGGKPKAFLDQLCNPDVTLLSTISKRSAKWTVIFKIIKEKSLFLKNKNKYYFVLIPGHIEKTGFVAFKRQFKILVYYILLSALGCRIIRIGNSYGKFSKSNKRLEKFSSKFIYCTAVRDSQSYNFAKASNFNNVISTPDLAWGFNKLTNLSKDDTGQYVVLSFRSNAYGIAHDAIYIKPIVERIMGIVRQSELKNYKLIIANQVEFDSLASKELYNELSKYHSNIKLIDKNLNLNEAYDLYSNARCVISNRLHVLLLAITGNVVSFPLINIADNKKIVDVFNDNFLSKTILDLGADLANNTAVVSQCLKNDSIVKNQYVEQISKNTKLLAEVFNEVFIDKLKYI